MWLFLKVRIHFINNIRIILELICLNAFENEKNSPKNIATFKKPKKLNEFLLTCTWKTRICFYVNKGTGHSSAIGVDSLSWQVVSQHTSEAVMTI